MSCQGKLFLMRVTYSIIIAMVVQQPYKGSVVELCTEKRIDQSFILSMVSPNHYLSYIKFPHAPQSWVFNQFLLVATSNNCFLQWSS